MKRGLVRIFYSNEIRRPPEIVFPWIADPEKAMRWQKNVKGGEIIESRPEMIGTTFIEILEEDGNVLEMRGEITEYIENQLIGFHLQSRIHVFDVSYTVEEINKATRLSIEVMIKWKFPMNIIGLFVRKRIEDGLKDQLRSEVLELKRMCESE
jgi:uncharacterized protein YndB with AHSA1/START domain